MRKITLCVSTLMLWHVTSAHAYIGPGLAVGTLAIVLGIISSIFFAFVGIVWYPIKRLLNGLKNLHRRPEPHVQETRDSTR